ncbi:pentapeptide repeat-containing protein [Algoriphagus halophilus]|uniref:Pentapeptide repeat-containing protein n=1 Tax=Algoriphagus halophilus TaxID=226505 RepID=A0A1N6DKD6_9BACT|nr:pentapeptide repeat-containing protein [Algoriphagus halophilus]SIN71228.1 Pentapeptide repeat-containing protein [Algoriphagus halophilus]
MANKEHYEIFLQGPRVWNKWREDNPLIQPDLDGEFIFPFFARKDPNIVLTKGERATSDQNLPFNFSNTSFHKASFESAVFPNANMTNCYLYESDLSSAGFPGADFSGSMIRKAYCSGTDFSNAKFIDCVLNNSTFIGTDFSGAWIEGCNVYGVSAWEVCISDETVQKELFLHRDNFSRKDLKGNSHVAFVDDIALAQFIYFIQQDGGFGKSLKQLNQKSVLLLGKFKDGGLELLRDVADKLRKRNFIPVIFDFNPSENTSIIENVVTMAGLSKFVIANLEGSSVPAELAKITSNFRNPVIAWIHDDKHDSIYAMFQDVIALEHVQYFTYTNSHNLETQLDKALQKTEAYMEELSKHKTVAKGKMDEGRIQE